MRESLSDEPNSGSNPCRPQPFGLRSFTFVV